MTTSPSWTPRWPAARRRTWSSSATPRWPSTWPPARSRTSPAKKSQFDNSGDLAARASRTPRRSTASCTACRTTPAAAPSSTARTRSRKAGIQPPPTSLDEFKADNAKIMSANSADPKFSAFYFPGKYWYAAMSFVYDYGGQIATQDSGQWKGTLDSAESQQGLTELKGIVDAASRADKTGDESKQDQAFAAGPHRPDLRQRLGGRRHPRPEDGQPGAQADSWPRTRCRRTPPASTPPRSSAAPTSRSPARASRAPWRRSGSRTSPATTT